MSKPVKEMLMRDYRSLLEGVENALVVSVRGVNANDNNRLRLDLAQKDIRITVIRNSLARRSLAETPLAGLEQFLTGPSALAYGGESVVDVARALVVWAKQVENLKLKGAILDGSLFEGAAGVRRLGDMPTREEAKAQVVTLVLTPGGNLVSAMKGPGARLSSILKTITDKLEKGETIARVSEN